MPPRREGGGTEPRRRALEVRRRGLLGCECHVGARCAAATRPGVRRPGGRLRLRPARAGGRGRHERRGRLLAPGDIAARAGVGDGLDHGRQRLHLRRAALRLRRRRHALRPRPVVPVPHGATGPARGVRPGGARLREADARRRGRVPPQGADVRARLADAAQGPDAGEPAARVPREARLASPPALRERCVAPRAARVELPARPAREGSTGWRGSGSSPSSQRRPAGRAWRATTRSSRGARWSRSKNYVERGVPAVWDKAPGTRVREIDEITTERLP